MKKKRFLKKFFLVVACIIVICAGYFVPIRTEIYTTKNFVASEPYGDLYNANIEIGEIENFKILLLNDLHMSTLMTFANNRTFNALDKVLADEDVDMVVLNGDSAFSLFNKYWIKRIHSYFQKKNLKVAFNFGNHDAQFGSSETRIGKAISKYNNSLFNIGYKNLGNLGNYVVNLTKDNIPVFSLFIINSGDSETTRLQTDWYEWQVNGINAMAGRNITNAVFTHVPFKATQEARSLGIINGNVIEDINYIFNDSGLYQKIVDLGATKYIFNGHDHPNNFNFTLDGIKFWNTLSSGYSGYQRGGKGFGYTIVNYNQTENVITSETKNYER